MADGPTAPPLSPAATQLLERIAGQKGDAPGLNHWLVLLLERFGKMAESMIRGFDASAVVAAARKSVASNDVGLPISVESIRASAQEVATSEGKSLTAERDIMGALLRRAGYEVVAPAYAAPKLRDSQTPSPESATAPKPPGARSYATPGPVSRPTPTLDRYGRDLTAAARDGKLGTVVGRDEELQAMILTLCRTTKPNPLLVGPAGTGKTAIVEGLALRIVRGEVPLALAGTRLVSLQPSSLLAGAGIVGELDKRMEAIVREASQPGVILFIDEVHAIMGAGGREGTGDMASMLKPALARGEISCIAATTDDEYRRFIENDKALERRFQPIRVNELTAQQTLGVLRGIRGELAERRGVTVGDDVLGLLVETASQRIPNRRFPDKAVDLLDHVVAHAISIGTNNVGVDEASAVVERLLGIPPLTEGAFEALRLRLTDDGLLAAVDAQALVQRLTITTRGLDLRTARPNATVLLMGDAAQHADSLARLIASTLFGAEDRVVRVNFARFTDHSGLHALLGSPPSYVGYADRHALDAVAELPWSVVLCERIDLAHPTVRAAFAPAISAGVLTDYRGRRIYFSDAVIVLTVDGEAQASEFARIGGFHADAVSTSRAVPKREDLETSLFGDDVAASLDLVVRDSTEPRTREDAQGIFSRVLGAVASRFVEQGVELEWDSSVHAWLEKSYDDRPEQVAVERLVEREVLPSLVHLAVGAKPGAKDRVLVRRDGGRLVIEKTSSVNQEGASP